uniref:Uncharacterized protein n=1 Tax=Guillardia theta TaxID=55529 RepID=A0A7S4KUR9_GUITH|mmetsp:Transcript_31162/g.99988  ORF Transcript_31162/g.99988 Transcript_31162/m.99988 type:complete len:120 (+) Transcript_31162:164-523(+)
MPASGAGYQWPQDQLKSTFVRSVSLSPRLPLTLVPLSPPPSHPQGDYPWWSCCMCAAEMGWGGWEERACQHCRLKVTGEDATMEEEQEQEQEQVTRTTTRGQARQEAHGLYQSHEIVNV